MAPDKLDSITRYLMAKREAERAAHRTRLNFLCYILVLAAALITLFSTPRN